MGFSWWKKSDWEGNRRIGIKDKFYKKYWRRLVMKINHVAIYVKDLEKQGNFMRNILKQRQMRNIIIKKLDYRLIS